MIKTVIVSMAKTIVVSIILVVACSFALVPHARAQNTLAQDAPQYKDGPVIEEDYVEVEYGHEDEYIAWLSAKWKPTMVALKNAGIIIDYHIYRANPRSPGLPNFILWIAFKNAADAEDRQADIDALTDKVICSQVCQNNARAFRNQYRKRLGSEFVREVLLP